ncbi:MAG: hypothetical protein ACP5D7_18860 [Limnospira sp.]
MKKTLADRYNQPISPEEQQLYDHWLERIDREDETTLIEHFRLLFVQGSGYPDQRIAQAMEKLLRSPHIEEEFNFILNRCCYILINRWHTNPNRRQAIHRLVSLFDEVSPASPQPLYRQSRRMQRLSFLIRNFLESEQYHTLKRFAEVLCQPPQPSRPLIQSEPLRSLIPRYPYLYRYCLLSEDSPYEHQQMIRQIQAQKQRKFELELSQYALHQMRRIALARTQPEVAKKMKIPLANPTLLNNRELFFALKQFVGKVEGGHTYRDLARGFISQVSPHQTFRSFKSDFYEYLIHNSFESGYLNRQFNEKLYKQLQNTIPHSDDEPFSEFLMLRTCSQLLNFLVVESPQKPNHFVFIDLIANIGPTIVVGLLLKIVLLCRKVKPHLENRFAVLFNHYESSSQEGLQWLVKVLENLNVGLTTNFGSVDLSFIR